MDIQKFANLFKNPQTNWKYILIVATLAFLVGGGILGYQYWWLPRQEIAMPEIEIPKKPVEDETADWKTYRNEEYGFEVKYPDDKFELKIKGDSACFESGEVREGPIGQIACDFHITPSLLRGLSLEEFIKDSRAFPEDRSLEELASFGIVFEKEIIGNQEWWRIHEPGHAEGIFHNYAQDENVVIDIWNTRGTVNESAEFRQILSTFRFLE